jgi:undecaprenyl-diphosphatase
MTVALAPSFPVNRTRLGARLVTPTTPVDALGRRTIALLLASVLLLAMAARLDGGRLLLELDRPVQRFVENNRGSVLDDVFLRISFLGSTYFVLIGGAVLALIAGLRCRATALLVVAATLARPPLEWLIKRIVGRDRPDLDQMVGGVGPSFPSGHVLAAAALWCLAPVVVSLYSSSVRLWWAAAWASLSVVFLIGASRVYLGVHWTVDVVAGFAIASLMLAGLDVAERQAHGRVSVGRDDARVTAR